MDDLPPSEIRKRNMSAVKSCNTGIELTVRKNLHKSGFRFRLHDKKLPGTPDIVFKSYKAVIFVSGCFWHGHQCHLFSLPKTRKEFWERKIALNKENDIKNISFLQSKNWRTCVIYGCALKGKKRIHVEQLILKLTNWLKSDIRNIEI